MGEIEKIRSERDRERKEENKRKKKKREKSGGRRDAKRRLRAFAAVLEPRLISPITPYSAATHEPPAPHHLLYRCRPPSSLSSPSRHRFSLALAALAPILLGATMERLTRSSPHHLILLPDPARASTFSRRDFSVSLSLSPFLPPFLSFSLFLSPRLHTTSVDEVCLTRGSVYRTYCRSLSRAISLGSPSSSAASSSSY